MALYGDRHHYSQNWRTGKKALLSPQAGGEEGLEAAAATRGYQAEEEE